MSVTDILKKTLLAGVGAAAVAVEKSSEIVDSLVQKGELTVEQGKALEQELRYKKEVARQERADEEITNLVNGLSDSDLAKLKDLISARENAKTETVECAETEEPETKEDHSEEA